LIDCKSAILRTEKRLNFVYKIKNPKWIKTDGAMNDIDYYVVADLTDSMLLSRFKCSLKTYFYKLSFST